MILYITDCDSQRLSNTFQWNYRILEEKQNCSHRFDVNLKIRIEVTYLHSILCSLCLMNDSCVRVVGF